MGSLVTGVVAAAVVAAVGISIDPAIDCDVQVTVYSNACSTTPFKLKKWNSHHGSSDQLGQAEMRALGTRAGRWLAPEQALFPLVPEDPGRPGYADLGWLRTSPAMSDLVVKLNTSAGVVGRAECESHKPCHPLSHTLSLA